MEVKEKIESKDQEKDALSSVSRLAQEELDRLEAEKKNSEKQDSDSEEHAEEKTSEEKEPGDEEIKKDEEEDSKKKEETKEEKQSRIDKRISELVSQRNSERSEKEAYKKELEDLRKERDDLNAKLNPPEVTLEDKVEIAFSKRIDKYLAEDADKPRAKRREMTKEQLQEWLEEDEIDCREWMTDRAARRREERKELRESFEPKKEVPTESIDNTEQNKIVQRVIKENPDYNIPRAIYDLQQEGKTIEEAEAILFGKEGSFKEVPDLWKENPGKYDGVDGFELLVQDIKAKRNPDGDKKETVEEIEARIREEIEQEYQEKNRREGVDEGVSSTVDKNSKSQAKEGTEGLNKDQLKAYNKAINVMGLTHDAALKAAKEYV